MHEEPTPRDDWNAVVRRTAAVFGLDDREAAEWDERFGMLVSAGRSHSADLVSDWWASGELDVKLLRALIETAWPFEYGGPQRRLRHP